MRAQTTDVDRLLLRDDFPGALALANADVQKGEQRGAGHDTELAAALEQRAWVLFIQGDISGETFKTTAERALALRESQAGSSSAQVKMLALLAYRAVVLGQKDQARTLVERALLIGGAPAHDHALALTASGALASQTGDYPGAFRDFDAADKAFASAGGSDPLMLARNLTIISNLRDVGDDFDGAAQAANAAMKAVERRPGRESLTYAKALSQLSVVESDLGEFGAAQRHAEGALATARARGAPPLTIARLGANAGNVSFTKGDFDSAVDYYTQAYDALEKAPGVDAQSLFSQANNIASAQMSGGGNVDDARRRLEQALAIGLKALGPTHVRLAATYINLGSAQLMQGDADAAQASYALALEIRSKALGEDNPLLADPIEGAGHLQLARQQYHEALDSFEHALTLREKLGKERSTVTAALVGIAQAQWGLGHIEAAYASALHAERIRIAELRRNAPSLSEREGIALEQSQTPALSVLLALAVQLDTDHTRREVWNAVIAERGLITDAVAWRVARARAQHDAKLAAAWKEWRTASAHYAKTQLDAERELSDQASVAIDEARTKIDRAERALALLLPAQHGRGDDDVAELVAALGYDDALLAFVSVEQRSAHDPILSGQRPGRNVYAFAVQGDSKPLRLIDLGSAEKMASSIARWYNDVRDPQTPAEVVQRAGSALRERIWDSVAAGAKAKHVYSVPDAALFRVNWAALPSGDGDRYLVETGPEIRQLDHERELLQPDASDPFGRSLLIAGAPDFDLAPAKMFASTGATAVVALERSVCGAGNFRFASLPGTEREARLIAAQWLRPALGDRKATPAQLLLGAKASKAALGEQAPYVDNLHFATHGFALGERCTGPGEAQRGFDLAPATAAEPPHAAISPKRELVGLALAGANRPASDAEHDGLLTSEDIASMDLHNARWVVLSACDSGLGQVIEGEGVFGLRRAFRLAGAHSVIMSLWPVADQATADWMAHLYQARFQQGLGTADALRSATLDALNARRAAGLSTQPYYWASFIAAGDWR